MKKRQFRARRFAPGIAALVGLLAAMAVATAGQARTTAAPQNTTPPTISGTAAEGKTLTASNGTWSGAPTSFFYQWQRCSADGTSCANITGATKKTYVVTANDVDHALRVVVTAANADGQTAAPSKPTAAVSSKAGPVNTAKPTITGNPVVGTELTASNGTWTGGVQSYAFQWQRCTAAGAACLDITGATGKAYGVRTIDIGQTLRVRVTATNASGSTDATSDLTAVVRDSTTTVTTTTSTTVTTTPPPPPGTNHRPTIAILAVKFVGSNVRATFRVCDDSRGRISVLEHDSKPGLNSSTRTFRTLGAVLHCATLVRTWLPAPAFRHGTYTIVASARDRFGLNSLRPARRTFSR